MNLPRTAADSDLQFFVTEAEIDAVGVALQAKSVDKNSPAEAFFEAILFELDAKFAGAGLVEKAKAGKQIGICVVDDPKHLPDQRLVVTPNPGDLPAAQNVVGQGSSAIVGARVKPDSKVGKRLGEVGMTPVDAEIVDQVRPHAEAQGMPYPTHQGVLELAGRDGVKVALKVYQLSDGQRVVDAFDLRAYFVAAGGM